ncbi:MAG: exodeoxyribonuclease V subunit gamma, partial [Elusimicrobia bacterium]|nr:exodeoxyribonuclease V subunit gamma [Elusimicrobiota bacterium]
HEVVDLLRSPYFRAERALPPGRAPSFRDRLPREAAELGVAAGWRVWDSKLDAASPPLSRLLREMREDARQFETASRGWADWAAATKEFLEKWLKLPRDASPAESAAWEHLSAQLQALSEFEALGPASWDFFLDTLAEKLENATLAPPPSRGVRVMSAMDARGESFRILFLLGLQEGLFPRQVREDPLLRDEVRSRLRHPGGYWIARKGSGHEEERLLFTLLVGSARERLYALYSRSDEEGKAQSPSVYLRELCRSAGREISARHRGQGSTTSSRGAGLDLSSACESVPRPPAVKWSRCPSRLMTCREAAIERGLREEGVEAHVLRLNAWERGGVHDGIIGRPDAFLKRLQAEGLSPSALESFSTCPFQFFSQYVLNLGSAEKEPERGALAPTLRGEIYHAVLEGFYRRLQETGFWNSSPHPSWETALSQAMESVFEAYAEKASSVYPLVWEAHRLDMRSRLERFVRWDMGRIESEGFIPAYFETELRAPARLSGKPEELPGLILRGRVDRIDLDAGGRRYRIVDYKTSWRRYGSQNLAHLIRGMRAQQLPIYAELSRALLPESALDRLCCYIIEQSQPAESEPVREYGGSDWEQDRPRVLRGIADLVSDIARGWFPIVADPGEFGHCRWCSFAGVCRKSHGPSRRRAEEEYAASSLSRLHRQP